MKKFLSVIAILCICVTGISARTETITVPIDDIYLNNNQYIGGEMIFELLTDTYTGERYLTLQANDISGTQIFGDMLEGPFRCIHQSRDCLKLGNIVMDSDLAEIRVANTFIPKDNNGSIWRFALIAINGKPSYYEISEWTITDVSNGLIHYKKTRKRATIKYTRYNCIKPILDMIRRAEERRILYVEELD